MKISELHNGSKANIEGKITEKKEPRDVNTRFGNTRVANATMEDDSGSITLVLWGDEIDKVNEGDTVKIENGFVKEWNNTLQVSAGKFGKMVIV
ncbi:MAG TPA: OB-fold nucleic acid binding domain-containing protein [archaeon]|nr:OB-fold nucleic acid binding domain-containing protein [archaeon]